jgi:threonine/homoserine/homoserine lactone efflux protein
LPVQDLALLFVGALIIGYSGALTPGPVLSMVVVESAKRGFLVGPLVVLGHGVLEVLVVIGLTLGLTQLVSSPIAGATIALLGGAFLLWMGASLMRDVIGKRISLDLSTPTTGGSKKGPVVLGVFTSASNPYWVIWWATVGAAYVTSALKFGIPGLVAFYSGHILADLTWYSMVSFLVSAGRRFFSVAIYRGILGFCGLALIFLAIYFGCAGVGFLRGV